MKKDIILILDLGGKQAQSLARLVRSSGVYAELVPAAHAEDVLNRGAGGLLITGEGREEALCDARFFQMGLPVLAMGAGARRMVELLGGRVGATVLTGRALPLTLTPSPLLEGLGGGERYFQRLDEMQLPEGFVPIARAEGMPAAFAREDKKLYAAQFDIESNDPEGFAILENFLTGVCELEKWWSMDAFRDMAIERIRARVGQRNALLALSGGVDSAVCAALMHRAIKENLHCIYVDTGLMRKDDAAMVRRVFAEGMGIHLTMVDAGERFLARLAGLSDPAEKWRVVGEEFSAIYEEEARKLPSVDYLVQGTTYSDLLEGQHERTLSPDTAPSLIEPVRCLFKDEVRSLGETLGLPPEIVRRQSFPGAGLAIRIVGAVTAEKLALLREADAIWRDEITQAGLDKRVRRYFAVLSDTGSTGAKHCERVLALRALGRADNAYTAYRMPYDLLERVTERILTQLPAIDCVVYDMTTTPPRSIEWE